MRTRTTVSVLAVFTTLVLFVAPLAAQRQPEAPAKLGRNAALCYWQAFAHMPKLDEKQQELLASAAEKLAESGKDALLYLRRGAAIGPCDWGLHREDGPYLLLPH